MNRKGIRALVAILLGLVLVVAVAESAAWSADTHDPLRLYLEAMSIVREQYVDPVSWDRIAHLGVRGLVAGLDPDTEVLTPEEYREVTADNGRKAADIGVVLTRRNEVLTVMTPIDGLPAANAGLQPGDQIVEIDGAKTADLLPVDAGQRLRGASGSSVALKIFRKGWPEPRPYTIVRAQRPTGTVIARGLGDGMFYARIRELDGSTVRELSQALTAPAAKEARGLVLDLRDATGKDVEAAVRISGLFLGGGVLVARVDGRMAGEAHELRTPPEPSTVRMPVAVLVNRGTAGAAEIIAGALRDADRSVVVGTATFGDASTQTLIPLSDGFALSLTTARYSTPNGAAIIGKGIAPDFVVDLPARSDQDTARASADTARNDPQLSLALDIVKAASIMGRGTPVKSAERVPSRVSQ